MLDREMKKVQNIFILKCDHRENETCFFNLI